MRHLTTLAILTAALFASACTSEELSRPALPLLEVTSPARGTMTEGLTTIEVTGTARPGLDGEAVMAVTVNGARAAVAADGSFAVAVALAPGVSFLETLAIDAAGRQEADTRAVVTGTMRPADQMIDNAISAALSAAAFDRLADAAGRLVEESDLGAFVAPFNPVLARGLNNGREDCLYGKVSVRPGLDVTTAAIAVVPVEDGLALDVDLRGLVVPLHARYAAACIGGATDITVRASRARIRGTLAIMVAGGRFDVRLGTPQVTLEGFNLQASGVPGAVLDLLDLDRATGDVLAWAVERFMAPVLDQALRGVAVGPQQLDILGQTVEVAVTPAGIALDPGGAEIMLDGRLRLIGSDARFVYTDDQVPPARTGAGFELAVSDDTINQALSGFWSAGALSVRRAEPLGMYDGVVLEALLPPLVSAAGDGSLRVAMGDLMVDFQAGGDTLTRVAFNLELTLRVEPNPSYNGAARLTIGMDRLTANVLSNSTGVADDQLETIFPGVARIMVDTLAPILGGIPLPSVYGISVTDLRVGGDQGYVTVAGDLN